MVALRGLVLAGGRASRLGGRHKPGIPIDGEPIVARAVAALRAAGAEALVVGEPAGVPSGVPVVREDPPFAGPLAGVAAGVAALEPRAGGVVLLVGGDMPFVAAGSLRALADAAADGVALAVDDAGRAQPLCAAWSERVLRDRLAAIGDPANLPMRLLVDGMDPTLVPLPARELMDVDTPHDLRAAQNPGR